MKVAVVVMALAQAPAADVVAFVTAFKRAVAADDRQAVAAMVSYPIRIRSGQLQIPIADAASLVQSYSLVFTPELKSAINQTTFASSNPAAAKFVVAATSTAMTLAGGYLGAEKINGAFKITRITLAGSTVGIVPASPPTAGADRARTAKNPERLTPQGRLRMAQATGTIAAGESHSFVIFVGQGQMLDARIDGVQGREAVLKIVNVKTGEALDARTRDGVRRWSGRISAGGDYRIDVVAGEPAPGSTPTYLLVVAVK